MKKFMPLIAILLIFCGCCGCLGFATVTGIDFRTMEGQSMEPTIKQGQNIIAYKYDRGYRVGDIIIFSSLTRQSLIKKIYAIGGDKVGITSAGALIVNGKTVIESGMNAGSLLEDIEYVVPARQYFVLGDNYGNSLDSRYFEIGFVEESDITSKVLLYF